MIKVVATSIDGRKCYVQVPEESEEWEYQRGIVVGPPDLSSLNLTEDVEVALNNELFYRGLITKKDIQKQRQEVLNALNAALAVSVDKVMECYNG